MHTLPTLPVIEALPALREALANGINAVLVAPPGAGKTTLAPLALLDEPWRANGRILVLEPRRLATRTAASRMASLIGESVGTTVGFRTRVESAVSAQTRIEVITEGLLVRRLLSDPGLAGVAAVMLDEVHERSLECDLALALCLDLQRNLRPELRLVAMSATIDGARLAELMQATVIESAGKIHPVRIEHAKRDVPSPRELPDALASAVRNALAEHCGDILAFLPGKGEIRRAQAALEGCGALVLPLHGEMPSADQDRALRPADGRRVVLATSIAETSLTVPGVTIVVDGGWRRTPRLDQASGLTRLATVRVSRAAADQRAGRAGREAPGIAIRLWSEAIHRGLARHDRPEMLEADLSGLALTCAAWGTSPSDLPFLDPPPSGALKAAVALLGELGALNTEGQITDVGANMAQLGAHPRLAAMMLAATDAGEAVLAADIAALLEERDQLRGGRDAPVDIRLRLDPIAHGDPAADRGALSRIRAAAAQYRRRLRTPAQLPAHGDPGRLLAAAFPDRIAQLRGEAGSFRLAGGGGARLDRADTLANVKLLSVASLDFKDGARISLAAPLDADRLPVAIEARVTETVEFGFDPATKAVISRRRRRLGALVLTDRTEVADPDDVAAALVRAAAADGLRALHWTEDARQLQARVALMRQLEPDTWPDLSDPVLADTAEDWLTPHAYGLSRIGDLTRLDVTQLLRRRLPHALATRLDRELPVQLELPGGRARVDYSEPVPLASARAQAFFGLAASPRLAGGRIALRFALLSPAGRPAAVTADLAGFWQGAWIEVRKELRGRYPKHRWPENGARP